MKEAKIPSSRRSTRLDFSPVGWGRVLLWTVFGTLGCVAVTLFVDSFNFVALSETARLRALLIDIILPIVLAVPLLLFLTMKLRELAIAHERLTLFASTDSLTSVLNRGAFTALVDAYLTGTRANDLETRGALLVIDADNFKSINDGYGHDKGDEALQIIAATIRSLLRAPDLVGRIGGEEFGIFLPGSDAAQAETVAERIRETINDATFRPDGNRRKLSVSVGGAVFDHRISFNDLFRYADQQLYLAKHNGRNRVAVAAVADHGRRPLAAA